MELSLNVICDGLADEGGKLEENPQNGRMQYQGILPYCSGTDYGSEIREHCVLAAKAEEFTAGLEGCALLCVGKPALEIISVNACILLPESADLNRMICRVQELFLWFNRWEAALLEHLNQPDFLHVGCCFLADYMHTSVVFHDDRQILLAWNDIKEFTDWHYDKSLDRYVLSDELRNQFKMSSLYKDTMNRKKVSLFDDDSVEYPSLYCNFFVSDQFIGRYGAVLKDGPPRAGDYQIMEYLHGLTERAFSYGNLPLGNLERETEKLLSEALNGSARGIEDMRKQLAAFQWGESDRYVVVAVPLEERDASSHTMVVSSLNLKQMYPDGFTLIKDEHIILLLNLTRSNLREEDMPSSLADFLREGFFKAGISASKSDIHYLADAYQEALQVIQIGNNMDPTKWSYRFPDYRMNYVYWKCLQDMSSSSLVKERFFRLEKYDRKHGTSLKDTLRVYLDHDRNLARTSDELYIHRSTLQYRLEKIENLTGFDLSDPETRFQLLFTYRLLDWEQQ